MCMRRYDMLSSGRSARGQRNGAEPLVTAARQPPGRWKEDSPSPTTGQIYFQPMTSLTLCQVVL